MSRRSLPVYAISFPEDLPPLSTVNRKPKTLIYLIRILYSSGALLTTIYLFSIFILKPLLERQYSLRGEYLDHVFDKLNGFFNKLTGKLNVVPSVAVKYKGTLYSDFMMQTDDVEEDSDEPSANVKSDFRRSSSEEHVKGVRFADEVNSELNLKPKELTDKAIMATGRIQNTLASFKDTLSRLKVSSYKEGDMAGSLSVNKDDISEMRPLMFQMKQFQNYLEMISSSHPRDSLFKRRITYGGAPRRPGQSQNILDDLRLNVVECNDILNEKRKELN